MTLLKASGLFKILAALNLLGIHFYREYQLSKIVRVPSPLDGLEIEVQVDWFIYLMGFTLFAAYLFSLFSINMIAFRPKSPAAAYLFSSGRRRLVYVIEIMLLVLLTYITYVRFKEAYPDNDQPGWNNLPGSGQLLLAQRINALHAWNLSLAVVASVLALLSFAGRDVDNRPLPEREPA